MDPEYAVAIAPLLSVSWPKVVPTAEQMRSGFFEHVMIPTQRFHANRLPPGTSRTLYNPTSPNSDIIASTYTVNDRTVIVDGAEIPVRCIIPVADDDSRRFPLFVHFHGGGELCTCPQLSFLLADIPTNMSRRVRRHNRARRLPSPTDQC